MTTARTLPCDTLSNSTTVDSNSQLDIMDIMGCWAAVEGMRWVYFARRDGLVKIGYSANPFKRVETLGAELLAVMPGGNRMERRMHMLFAEYRSHGEWFHPGLRLVGFIEALHGDNPYLRAGLPDGYARAEVERTIAAERDEDARAAMVDQVRALTVGDERPSAGCWPPPIPGDREAADLIGRILGRTLAVAS